MLRIADPTLLCEPYTLNLSEALREEATRNSNKAALTELMVSCSAH